MDASYSFALGMAAGMAWAVAVICLASMWFERRDRMRAAQR